MKIYSIKITAKGFGESKGTIHKLRMSENAAKEYCEKMNSTECYSKWATYEMVEEETAA